MNLNFIIFLVVAFISFSIGNNIDYIFLDSAGFVFYLVLTPILLLIVKDRVNIEIFVDFFIKVSVLFSILSILIFSLFASIFGALTLDSITVANDLIQKYINLKLGATGGVLRINTNTVQVLLISFYLVLMERKLPKFRKSVFLAILFLGIIVDGHRVIMFSAAVLALIYMVLYKKYILLSFFTATMLLTILFNLESVSQRLDFDNVSTNMRVNQVGPLLMEIDNKPIIGNGFGSSASLIRNEIRPFMYEVDFLAVMMKLGIPLTVIYTLLWFVPLLYYLKIGIHSLWFQFSFILILLSLLYMTSNGGFYLSPLTTIIQYLILISLIYTYEIYRPKILTKL